MKELVRIGKLNIIEPWEFGTEKAIEVSIVNKDENQYLISIFKPLLMKGMVINYLVGELREEENSIDLFSDLVRGVFALNLIYSDKINAQNFKNYFIKDARGNFLLGEIIF